MRVNWLAGIWAVSTLIGVSAFALISCAERPTPLHDGPPTSQAYPQVQDQCDAQPWLAWCAAEAEKRRT